MGKLKFKLNNEEREKISLVLKVVTYLFVCVWDLVFLGVAYWAYIEYLHPSFPQGGFYLLFRPWYLITIILIAVWIAAHGMMVIGKWEYPKRLDKSGTKENK
jgi:hypothetical protein